MRIRRGNTWQCRFRSAILSLAVRGKPMLVVCLGLLRSIFSPPNWLGFTFLPRLVIWNVAFAHKIQVYKIRAPASQPRIGGLQIATPSAEVDSKIVSGILWWWLYTLSQLHVWSIIIKESKHNNILINDQPCICHDHTKELLPSDSAGGVRIRLKFDLP